jgi:putative peptide zinc metalloprotease protein
MLDELAAGGFLALDCGAPRVRRSLVRVTISVPDPDRVLGRLYKRVRLLYVRPVQLVLLAVALVGAALYGLALAGGVSGGAGRAALVAVVALEVHVVLHELAHALTTKHFGRGVHRMGVGWYFATPVAFVDTSDMWLEGKRRRMAVAAAGPYVNLVLSGAAGCALPFAGAGARADLLLFATTGYVLALVNANPLYELDGYHVLTDLLGVANLRTNALAFVGAAVSRRPRAAVDRRLARIFAGYGIAAALYLLVASGLVLLGYRRFVQHAAAHVLPASLAALLGWTLAGALASLLLVNLGQSLRGRARSRVSG